MNEEFATVATFEFANQAELARMRLEEEGIQAFIADAELVSMNWLFGAAVGFIKLQVPRSQAEKAAAILATMPPPERPRHEEAEGEEAETRCLACGAKMPENEDICPQCGWSYEAEEEG